MKIIKIILSLIALLAAALGATQAAGGIKWNPALIDLIMAGATVLGTFGIVPFMLTLAEHRACAGIATFTSALVAAHAAGTIPGAPKVFNVVAVGAALLSVLGSWNAPAPAPAPAAKA
ncbi:MAG TPA: hypothetical protein VGY48_15855 [Vicinamibacterales bacterium]|jgi:hypothetical protein|nr:hypothetical protein [Vicinamibacterales bacterium]